MFGNNRKYLMIINNQAISIKNLTIENRRLRQKDEKFNPEVEKFLKEFMALKI